MRLPIQEHGADLGLGGSHRLVLNINDVVAALVTYNSTGDWVRALNVAIPERKRFHPRSSRKQRRGRGGGEEEPQVGSGVEPH